MVLTPQGLRSSRRDRAPVANRRWAWFGSLLASLAASMTLGSAAGLAAEEVFFEFGPLSRSVPTSSLENFAATGVADESLAPYINRLNPEQQQGLREALTFSRTVDLLRLSQWFYSTMGEEILLFAGNLMKTEAGDNGQQALRAALIAAAEDGEISLLDVIQQFPTTTLRFDLDRILQATEQVIAEAEKTLTVLDAVARQSVAEAALPPPLDLAALPDLTQPGPYRTRQTSLTIEDSNRNRTYPVEIFAPQNLRLIRGQLPVVVISHGLGDSRTSFFDIGRHLASYGFVVALPEHIGSNSEQKEALFSGRSNEVFIPQEFLDRPLDVTRLLDELARTNSTQYWGKINLDRVAVVGHSFGGYTALALAGATIDFDLLRQQCTPEANILLNAAQLLECRALELTDQPTVTQILGQTGVRDPRVKLVVAYSPVSQLLGESGISRIQIPTMLMGGVFDVVSPAVPQQVNAFRWLTTPDKYLYLAEGSSHTADLTRITNQILNLDRDLEQGIEDALDLSRALVRALSVAFAEVYLKENSDYEPFLRSAYVETVSQPPFKRHLVRTLPEELQPILGQN